MYGDTPNPVSDFDFGTTSRAYDRPDEKITADPEANYDRWTITFLSLGAVALLTGVQYVMFSVNSLCGVFGLPVLVFWCVLAHRRGLSLRVHAIVALALSLVIGFIPMAATIAEIKLVPG